METRIVVVLLAIAAAAVVVALCMGDVVSARRTGVVVVVDRHRAQEEEERLRFLPRARQLLAENILIDGHNDWPYTFHGSWDNQISDKDLYDIPNRHTDINRLRQGQVGGQFWSVYVSCRSPYTDWSDDVRRTMDQIDVTRRLVELHPDEFQLALTAQDARDAFAAGKIASFIGMEGGHSLDNSIAALRMFYLLGARYMTLTHNCNLAWVDSHNEPPEHNGLTDFGERMVAEMNRLGILIDISHVSDEVMRQVLTQSKAPVIFSHSSARAVCDVTRNVPDDVLQMVPANGAVVMVNFYSGFVCESILNCTLSDVADHIEYIANISGVDYVGFGADYDGVDALPDGLEDVSRYPYLVAELLRRGFSDEDVAKIMGGNVLRALEGAEQVARELQASTLPDESTISVTRTCP